MNSPVNFNVVHESEAQRQHARVRLPGDVVFLAGADTLRAKLHDISAGGFAFDAPAGRSFKVGELMRGELRLKVDGIGLTVPITFHVRNHQPGGRTGCAFQDLGPREISLLRHIITSFLAGELISVGDVLHTLGRENFTKARPGVAGGDMGKSARTKAVALSSLMLAVGVAAFAYAGTRLYDLYFVKHATAARVAAPTFTVSMPRDGVFQSLVPPSGVVKKGAPLGSFQTAVSDVFDTDALSKLINPDQLAQIVGQSIKGTITSPCDCRVQTAFAGDQQYVGKGQSLFTLAPESFKPYVLARFDHADIDDLTPGTRVSFQISGESEKRKGRIAQVRANGVGDQIDGDIVVQIEPEEPLSTEFVSRPVALSTGGLFALPGSVDSLAVAKVGR